MGGGAQSKEEQAPSAAAGSGGDSPFDDSPFDDLGADMSGMMGDMESMMNPDGVDRKEGPQVDANGKKLTAKRIQKMALGKKVSVAALVALPVFLQPLPDALTPDFSIYATIRSMNITPVLTSITTRSKRFPSRKVPAQEQRPRGRGANCRAV